MESHIQATMARIAEIQSRLGGYSDPPISPISSQNPSSTQTAEANRPFDILLAQAGGGVKLRPTGGTSGPFSAQIESLITKYAGVNGIPTDMVRAVIQQESGGNTRSTSVVGAKGLMQLMPETAQGYGVHDAYDPEENIAAGTRHLAGMLREFKGDVPQALAAYNAGAGAVRKYGGVPPYSETQQYVQKIMGMMGH